MWQFVAGSGLPHFYNIMRGYVVSLGAEAGTVDGGEEIIYSL